MTTKRTISERHADTSILLSHFSRKEKGDLVSYEEIEKVIGWDIRKNTGPIETVKNRMLSDYGIVVQCETNVGYELLTDAKVAEGHLQKDRAHRHRSAQRSKRKAQAVDLSELNETQKLRCIEELTIAHVEAESTTDKAVRRIGQSLNGATEPLALNRALEAIKKNL